MNNKASQDEGVSSCIYGKGEDWQAELPSEPPHYDKKPKDEDNEDDVPQPPTPLTLSHIIHAPKRASEYARRFRKCVVLHVKRGRKKKPVVGQSVSQPSIGMRIVKRMCRRWRRRRSAPTHRCTQTVTEGEGERKQRTHHLTELDGRLAYLIPNPNRDLKDVKERKSSLVNYTPPSHLEPEGEREREKKKEGEVTPNHAARSTLPPPHGPRW
jgi:hypothetical protein